jgi:hypothetical protein
MGIGSNTHAFLWETVTLIACSGWEIHGKPQSECRICGSRSAHRTSGKRRHEGQPYVLGGNRILIALSVAISPEGFRTCFSGHFWRKYRLRNVLFCSNKYGIPADKQNYGSLPIITFRPLSLTCILVDSLSVNITITTFPVISVLIRLSKRGFSLPTTTKYRWSRCIFPFIVTLETESRFVWFHTWAVYSRGKYPEIMK